MQLNPLQPQEIALFRKRILVIACVLLMVFIGLFSRLWYLQILKGEMYADVSKGNRIRLLPLAAPRGIIYDRSGVVFAENRPAYQLELVREDTPDLEKTITNLSKILEIPYYALKHKVLEGQSQAPFRPIILDSDLDYRKAALIETYQEEFLGVSIIITPRRFYPQDKLASHALGYIAQRTEKEQEFLPDNKRQSGMMAGRTGVEWVRNDLLVGSDGGKQVEVDHVGRELEVLNQPVPAIPGKAVHLSIDIQLQQVVHEAMEGKSGAVIVMRPKTGEILAMGSFPEFNPNLFSAGITRKNWNRLLNTDGNPLENKVVQGQYPPGSIFKLVTAYAGLDLGIINEHTTFTCDGYYHLAGRNRPYKCWRWKEGGHGTVNLEGAIRGSCNVFFYNVGQAVGIQRLHEYATYFGFGQETGIHLPNEKPGLVPSDAWKRATLGERWYLGETPPASIGQGYTLVTPIQMINFINIIANGGLSPEPTLLLLDSPPSSKLKKLSAAHVELIKRGMVAAANQEGGTARVVHSPDVIVAGKTATSQVVGHQTLDTLGKAEQQSKELQSHGWIAAFAPADDPQISVIVLVEHGGSGSAGAGPIAKRIIDYYTQRGIEPSIHEAPRPKVEISAFGQALQDAFSRPN